MWILKLDESMGLRQVPGGRRWRMCKFRQCPSRAESIPLHLCITKHLLLKAHPFCFHIQACPEVEMSPGLKVVHQRRTENSLYYFGKVSFLFLDTNVHVTLGRFHSVLCPCFERKGPADWRRQVTVWVWGEAKAKAFSFTRTVVKGGQRVPFHLWEVQFTVADEQNTWALDLRPWRLLSFTQVFCFFFFFWNLQTHC